MKGIKVLEENQIMLKGLETIKLIKNQNKNDDPSTFRIFFDPTRSILRTAQIKIN